MPPKKTQVTLAGAKVVTRSAHQGSVKLRALMEKASPEWAAAIWGKNETLPYEEHIQAFLDDEINQQGQEVFPPLDECLSAFAATPLSKLKVVLIGQDPYHDNNQAHGLCFSVRPGIKAPPSLVNMYKELATDGPDAFKILADYRKQHGISTPTPATFEKPTDGHGYLLRWAQEEGILMLNATLTVRAHQANSHAKDSKWALFTDDVIRTINKHCPPGVVFLLWGGFAQKKGKIIDTNKHIAVSVAHPSPLSVKSWTGCKTFSKCNAALASAGREPVDWSLPPTAPKE